VSINRVSGHVEDLILGWDFFLLFIHFEKLASLLIEGLSEDQLVTFSREAVSDFTVVVLINDVGDVNSRLIFIYLLREQQVEVLLPPLA